MRALNYYQNRFGQILFVLNLNKFKKLTFGKNCVERKERFRKINSPAELTPISELHYSNYH